MIGLKQYVFTEVLGGKKNNWLLRLLKIALLGSGGQRVVLFYRLAKYLYANNMKYFSMILFRRLEMTYGVYISPNSNIGIGLRLPHPTGIIVGDGVKLGSYCTLYQQVTLGGARLGDAGNNYYPDVGDNVVFFAGSKIIGKIKIGSNAVIGANSVVTKDVPEGCTVAGIPAKIIRGLDK